MSCAARPSGGPVAASSRPSAARSSRVVAFVRCAAYGIAKQAPEHDCRRAAARERLTARGG